jgi:hypothetical protein
VPLLELPLEEEKEEEEEEEEEVELIGIDGGVTIGS